MSKFFKKNKAFSLIEVLFVIIIIGILSSVIFLILREPIKKAKDSRIINAIKQIVPFAEIIHLDEASYNGLCNDPHLNDGHASYGDQLDSIAREVDDSDRDINCYTDIDEYCVYSGLNISTSQWFCVDSTGKAGLTTTNPNTTCNGTTFVCP